MKYLILPVIIFALTGCNSQSLQDQFDAGYQSGKDTGYQRGVEDGKNSVTFEDVCDEDCVKRIFKGGYDSGYSTAEETLKAQMKDEAQKQYDIGINDCREHHFGLCL